MRKKTNGSLNLTPWIVDLFFTLTFLEGYKMCKGNDKKTAEGMNEHCRGVN